MTIKLLTPRGVIPINAVITLDAATEAALVADKVATTDLTGGTVWAGVKNPASPPAGQAYPDASSVSGAGNTLPNLGIFGDSVVAALDASSLRDKSPVGLLLAHAGNPFNITHYGGIGGQTTAQIVARVLTQLAAQRFDSVLFYMGTNDVVPKPADTNATVTTIINGYRTCIDAAKAAGVSSIIVMSMFPFQAAYALTAAQKGIMVRVNSLLQDYCRTANACYLDLYSPISDATGLDAAPSKMTDDFHPGNNGCISFGKLNAPALLRYINRTSTPIYSASQGGYATDSDSKTLLKNPLCYGTAGTLSNGATGSAPDNIRVRKLSGAGASTCAASIVPANVGAGQAVRLTLGSLVAGEQWSVTAENVAQYNDPVSAVPFVRAGDKFYCEAIVKTSGAAGVLSCVTVWMSYAVTGGALNGTTQYCYAHAYTSATADVMDQDIGPIQFRSPAITMPADATSIAVSGLYVQTIATAAGSCTVDVEKMNIVKV